MKQHSFLALALSVPFSIAGTGLAMAICSAPATPIALQSFDSDPAAWLKANGNALDLDAQITALAAVAVNSKDATFGKSLSSILGIASNDQGTKIGRGLGSLSSRCTDPIDPANKADKQYISTNIAPNVLTNQYANTAYGIALGEYASAATGGGGGGGGGGGTGVSPVSSLPNGGSNNGTTGFGTTATPVTFSAAALPSSGGVDGNGNVINSGGVITGTVIGGVYNGNPSISSTR